MMIRGMILVLTILLGILVAVLVSRHITPDKDFMLPMKYRGDTPSLMDDGEVGWVRDSAFVLMRDGTFWLDVDTEVADHSTYYHTVRIMRDGDDYCVDGATLPGDFTPPRFQVVSRNLQDAKICPGWMFTWGPQR